MRKFIEYLLVLSLLTGAMASAPLLCAAESISKTQDKSAAQTRDTTEKSKPKRDWYPFYGFVSSVDKQANTISLKKKQGERVLKLDAKSTLQVNGRSAVIGNVSVGDYAHGTLHKDGTGKEVIKNARFDKEAPNKEKKI